MIRPKTEFAQWSATFNEACLAPRSVDPMRCPTCGSHEFQLIYLIDDPVESYGMFAFWCDACLTGHPPGIGPIPDGARRVRHEDARIPDYRLVIEP
jgi:hypothetical protein